MKNKKEKNRRSKVKHPALQHKFTHRLRQELLDYDYLDKLSESELDFLNKFTEEYQNASFKHDETDIDSTPEGKKASYDRNNARNRDLYGNLRYKKEKYNNKRLLSYESLISGDLTHLEDQLHGHVNPENQENAYIDYLDDLTIREMMEEYEDAMSSFNEDDE